VTTPSDHHLQGRSSKLPPHEADIVTDGGDQLSVDDPEEQFPSATKDRSTATSQAPKTTKTAKSTTVENYELRTTATTEQPTDQDQDQHQQTITPHGSITNGPSASAVDEEDDRGDEAAGRAVGRKTPAATTLSPIPIRPVHVSWDAGGGGKNGCRGPI
jgi:hypothetical protein